MCIKDRGHTGWCHAREAHVQVLPTPPERANQSIPVQLRHGGVDADPHQPRLLRHLADGRGIQRSIPGFEMTAELQPHAGLAVVGEQDALPSLVEHQHAGRQMLGRSGLCLLYTSRCV